MSQHPQGAAVAANILYMRVFGDRSDARAIVPAILLAGKDVLACYDFTESPGNRGHDWGEIATLCLRDGGYDVARDLMLRYGQMYLQHETSAFEHPELIKAILAVQPLAALDAMAATTSVPVVFARALSSDVDDRDLGDLDALSPEELVAWCERGGPINYMMAGAVVRMASRGGADGGLDWTSQAIELLKRCPDPVALLVAFDKRMRPRGWSGSLAEKLERYVPLLENVATIVPSVALVARQLAEGLRAEVDRERRREALGETGGLASFE